MPELWSRHKINICLWLFLLFSLSCIVNANDTIQIIEKKLKTLPVNEQVSLLNDFCSKNYDNYPEKSLEYARKALSLARQTGNIDSIVNALNNIANGHMYYNNHNKAIQYYLNALKLEESRKNSNPTNRARLYNNLGIVYWNLKDYDKSLEYYFSALKIKENLNNKFSLGSTVNNIGLIYLEKKNFSEALRFFRRALTLFTDTNTKKGIGHALNNLGDAYAGLGNYQPALTHYRQAMVTYESTKFNWGISNTGKNIGKLYTSTGEFEKAHPYLQKALTLAKEIKSDDLIIKSYLALAQLYETIGQYDKALEYQKKYFQMNTNVYNEKTSKQRIRMQAEYSVEQKENEIRLLRKNQDSQRIINFFLVLCMVLSLLLAGVSYNRYKNKKRINNLLRASESKYRTLFSEAGDVILLLENKTEKYVVFDCNDRTSELLGINRELIIGQTLDFFSPPIQPDKKQSAQAINKKVLHTFEGRPHRFYWKFIKKDKTPVDTTVSLSRVEIDNRPLVQAIVHDITEHNQLEAERFKSAKLESVGILAGGIAHDFNNLLAVIMGNLEIVKIACSKDTKITGILARIEKSALTATDLANQFLTFSEGGHPIKRKVTLGNSIRVAALSVPLSKGIQMNIDIPTEQWQVDCDIDQMKRVIISMVENAHDAIGEKGSIDIKITNTFLEADEIRPLPNGRYVVVSIEDSGIGIPTENLPMIFDPYFTTRENQCREGIGLGLSIAHSIIKQHAGTITVSSHEGKGTVFSVYLPAAEDNEVNGNNGNNRKSVNNGDS